MAEFGEKYINPFTDYDKLRERVFEKLFETAEIARFTPDQVRFYEDNLKYYRDLKNSLDTAREEGILEGIEKVAIEMLLEKEPIEKIIRFTGLSLEQIEKLRWDRLYDWK